MGGHASVTTRGLATQVGKTFLVKLGFLALSGIAVLLTTRVIVEVHGVTGLALYSIVTGFAALMPFADLGLGAAVTDAAAKWPAVGSAAVKETLRKGVMAVARVGLVVIAVAVSFFALGSWQEVLGVWDSRTASAALAGGLSFAVSMPMVMGYRLMLGLRRPVLLVAVQSTAGLVGVGAAAGLSAGGASLALVCAAPSLFNGLGGAVCLLIGLGQIGKEFAASTPAGVYPRVSHRGIALPALIISVCLPLAFQSDRLVLAHVQTARDVAIYAAALQLYMPAYSLVATATQQLWPHFTSERKVGQAPSFRQLTGLASLLGLVGVCLGGGLVILGPSITEWTTAGEATAGWAVFAGFAALLATHSIHAPFGASQMDEQGLKFQAVSAVVMVCVNIPLSVFLAHGLGPVGPVLASSLAIAVCMTLPALARARRVAV
jgi:O-antigen/teichoic acid export membrane protein